MFLFFVAVMAYFEVRYVRTQINGKLEGFNYRWCVILSCKNSIKIGVPETIFINTMIILITNEPHF